MAQQLLTESPEKTKQQIARREVTAEAARSVHDGFPSPILQLHRSLGNQRVAQLVQAKRLTTQGMILNLQRKLTVGAADDQYEQEADRVARQVVSMPDSVAANSMQRAVAPEEDKDQKIQTKPLAASITPVVQRQMGTDKEEDKDKPIQPKSATSLTESFEAGADVESQLSRSKGGGSPLPDPVRTYMEPRFGVDFSHVRVHTGSHAVQMNRAVAAQAFTHGADIYYGAGSASDNLELTAHELTHVVQQTGAVSLKRNGVDHQESATRDLFLQRFCGACAGAGSPCASCAAEKESIQRKQVQSPFGGQAKHVVIGEHQKLSGADKPLQRYSWDEFTNDISSVGSTALKTVKDVGSAVVSGAEALGGAVVSGAQAVASGAQAVGSAMAGGAKSAGSGVQAGGGVVSWLLTKAGKLALSQANAIAKKFGGSVTANPSGGIDITIGDADIAEVQDETFILPIGIPTETLFEAPFEVGSFVINAWVGTIFGDPALTFSTGPVKLQNILLHLDPFGNNYSGTAELYVGSAVSGSIEKAHEARLQAAGILPFEPPIPIEGSAAVGLRTAWRIAGKEGFRQKVIVGYSGGNFLLDAKTNIQLGALAEVDNEAFLRIEIEGKEICSVIWPLRPSQRLGDAGVEITVPFSLSRGPGGSDAKISKPLTKPITVDAIETNFQKGHAPADCLSLKELADFLCKSGKLPPDICAVVASPAPALGPAVPASSPNEPVVPSAGPIQPVSVPTGITPSDPIEMQWYKPDDLYDTPIVLDGQTYQRKRPGQTLPAPDFEVEIGVEREFLPRVGKLLILAFEPDKGTKKRFNQKLKNHGYSGNKGRGTDADHNQDLQWAGPDEFFNLWPFDSSANRSAGPLQNDLQFITFSDRPGGPARTMKIGEFKTLGLHRKHKFFIIKCISLTPNTRPPTLPP